MRSLCEDMSEKHYGGLVKKRNPKESLKIKVDLGLYPEIVPGRETPFNE